MTMNNNDNNVYYIAYFDTTNKDNLRHVSPAAITKSEYLSKKIASLGKKVQIISPAIPNKPGIYKASNDEIFDNVRLKLFKTFYAKNFLQKSLRRLIITLKIYFYLLFKIPRKSTVIIYHSPSLMKMTKILKKIKKINFILEFNEIYGDVINNNKLSKKEIFYSKIADSYIFPTEILATKINMNNKSYVINYGTYELNDNYNESFNDELIHCVYAGTFSIDKGVLSSIKAAEYLDENYHLHILGFGSEKEINIVKSLIDEIKPKTKCKITYHGTIYGKEFDKFLSKCNIGLSTQSLENNFNDTSFPSKVLKYLSSGLKVVSIDIKAVSESILKEYISFYEEDKPEKIAKAIVFSASNKLSLDPKDLIRNLDVELSTKLKKIL